VNLWLSSVCLSVPCLILRHEWKGVVIYPKIGRKEFHDMGDPRLPLEVERSKVKVTRPLNVVTEISHIFGTGRPVSHYLQGAGHIVAAALRAVLLVIPAPNRREH